MTIRPTVMIDPDTFSIWIEIRGRAGVRWLSHRGERADAADPRWRLLRVCWR